MEVAGGRGQVEPALSQDTIFTKLYVENKTLSPPIEQFLEKTET